MNKIFIYTLALATSLSANQMPQKAKTMPLGPVHGSSGTIVQKDSITTTIKSIYMKKDRTYDGNDKINDPKKRKMEVFRHNFIIRYGLGENFDIRFIIPLLDKEMKMFNPKAKASGDFSNTNLGDIRVFFKHEITSQKKGDFFSSAIDLGLELPTGSYDKDFHLENGKKLPNHNPQGMQSGDGSIDPILALSATKLLNKHRIDLSGMYFFNQKGKNEFKKGQAFNYDASYSYLLHPKFMPSVEINGKYSAKNKIDGIKQDDTGGNEIFATFGFSSHITKSFKIFAGYGLPIFHDLNRGSLGTEHLVTTKLVYKW